MNQRDIALIKRRLNPDHRWPSLICGCYINCRGEVLSTFVKQVPMLPQQENEKYMALFRRVLTGAQGQNLLSIEYDVTTAAPEDQCCGQPMLMDLCRTELSNEQCISLFYQKLTEWIHAEKQAQPESIEAAQSTANRLILLLYDAYDLPYHKHDGEDDRELSENVFNYILCCVCPVKLGKPSLSYVEQDSEFHSRDGDWTVGAPDMGFMYPCMENNGADLYHALYYTRDAADTHDLFLKHVLNNQIEMPAPQQTAGVCSILQNALQDECNMELLQSIQEKVTDMMNEAKEDKSAEPLQISRKDFKRVLQDSGVTDDKVDAFEKQYEEVFGAQTELPAVNIVSSKEFRVNTPNVSIRVDPEHADLISTRVIDGQRYIMVLADGNVEVNGVNVAIL